MTNSDPRRGSYLRKEHTPGTHVAMSTTLPLEGEPRSTATELKWVVVNHQWTALLKKGTTFDGFTAPETGWYTYDNGTITKIADANDEDYQWDFRLQRNESEGT